MPPTPQQTAAGYGNMWSRATVKANRRDDALALARRIAANKARYAAVQAATGVPWPMIGALHNRESGLSFAGHLHNGDSLKGYTRQVPAGRPKVGHGPPFTWQESAIDALIMPAHKLNAVKTWSIERILYECERYNGWGYLGKGNSPYLWSWTSEYHGGKYVADHVYSPSAWDAQAGCVAVFQALIEIDPDAASLFGAAPREATPPKDAVKQSTAKQRKARSAGAASAAAGGGGEGAKQSGTLQPDAAKLAHPVLTWTAVGVGVAVVIVATILIERRTRLLHRAWSGVEATAPGLLARAAEAAGALWSKLKLWRMK